MEPIQGSPRFTRNPRVARASQPWADGWNAVGVRRDSSCKSYNIGNGRGRFPPSRPRYAVTTSAQRSQSSGCAAIVVTLGRCRQQRAHFACDVADEVRLVSAPAMSVRSLRMKNSSSSLALPSSEASRFASAISQRDRAFERVADALLLSRGLDGLRDDAAEFQQLLDVRFERVCRAAPHRLPGRVSRCTEVALPANSHASSAVKARIGASSRARASKTRRITVCVARRRGEFAASQYMRSLVMST